MLPGSFGTGLWLTRENSGLASGGVRGFSNFVGRNGAFGFRSSFFLLLGFGFVIV